MSNFTFTVTVSHSNANVVPVFVTLCLVVIAPCCRFLLGPVQVEKSNCVIEFWTSNELINLYVLGPIYCIKHYLQNSFSVRAHSCK
jgi:hypothetical protein